MAVTTEDRKVTKRGLLGGLSSSPAPAGLVIPHGRAVFIDATTGRAAVTSNGGANLFAGISHARLDNSEGGDDEFSVEYWIQDRFELAGSGFAADDVGKVVYLADNGDGLTLVGTAASKVGVITEFVSAAVVEVNIEFAAA